MNVLSTWHAFAAAAPLVAIAMGAARPPLATDVTCRAPVAGWARPGGNRPRPSLDGKGREGEPLDAHARAMGRRA